MQAFHLVGDRYQKAELSNGRFLLPSIELSLGLWQGSYSNIDRLWLRWMTLEGDLIPTLEEKEAAAKQRAYRLAAKLRELGIGPDELSYSAFQLSRPLNSLLGVRSQESGVRS